MEIELQVSDLFRTMRFYDELFAVPSTGIHNREIGYYLKEQDLYVAMRDPGNNQIPIRQHSILYIKSLEELVRRFDKLRAVNSQLYYRTNKSKSVDGIFSISVRDPDGHYWNLVEDKIVYYPRPRLFNLPRVISCWNILKT